VTPFGLPAGVPLYIDAGLYRTGHFGGGADNSYLPRVSPLWAATPSRDSYRAPESLPLR
jgi:hypothetical protein